MRENLSAVKVYDTVESTLTYVESSPLLLACNNYMWQIIKVEETLHFVCTEYLCAVRDSDNKYQLFTRT